MKKAITHFLLYLLSIIVWSCSKNNDDNGSDTLSIEEIEGLLTSGKWYQESKMPGSFSDCEKNISFQFNSDSSLIFDNYDDGNGTCEPQTPVTASYTLNDSALHLTLGGSNVSASINSISDTELSITDFNGDMVTFDRIQG
ncbi:MAG: lipocalin family protein [Croceivirga sp.]